MLQDLPEDAAQYKNVAQHVSALVDSNQTRADSDLRQIEFQSPTIRQMFTFERSVLVGQGWGGGNCEFIVTLNSIRPGNNWFHQW